MGASTFPCESHAPHSGAATEEEELRHAAAAILVFLAAAARARLVAPYFRHVATHGREIELQFRSIAVFRNAVTGGHSLAAPSGRRTGRSRGRRSVFAQKKL